MKCEAREREVDGREVKDGGERKKMRYSAISMRGKEQCKKCVHTGYII